MSATYPNWIEHDDFAGSFTLQLSPTSAFGVHYSGGSKFHVVLPGKGIARAWNRDDCVRICREFVEDKLANETDDEDEPAFDEASKADFQHQLRMEERA